MAILCTVLGANPPYEIIKRYIARIWAEFSIDKILMIQKGVFLVHFENLKDKEAVVKRGIYFFHSKPFVVKGWSPDLDIQTDRSKTLPLWIRLPHLDMKYWGPESLSKICSVLGVPIKTDRYTKEKSMLRYARVLVDMPIEGPFPTTIDFFNEAGILTRQEVHYEWLPIKCEHCKLMGHKTEDCRKKCVIRQEWIPVGRAKSPQPHVQPVVHPEWQHSPRPGSLPPGKAPPSVRVLTVPAAPDQAAAQQCSPRLPSSDRTVCPDS